MTNQLNMEQSKDKKKSFFTRLFSFANHSPKLQKPKVKRKIKKLNERKSRMPLLPIENDATESVTFCDYCDREIFVKFTGQDIICHEFCKKKTNDAVIEVIGSEINPYLGSSTLTSSVELHSNAGTGNLLVSRLSSSVKDLSLSYLQNDDDDDDDDSATLNTSSTISTYRGTSISGIPNNFTLTTSADTYTYGTVDLPTVKKYGIPIRNSMASNQYAMENPPRNEKEIITKSSDCFDNQSISGDLESLISLFNDNDQGLLIEHKNNQLMGKVRLFINLLRPVRMLLTARPPSRCDTFHSGNKGESTIDRCYYNRPVLLWLPRDHTNLLYANINCSTNDLISMLLTKFNIQNNPKKFALYEHTTISPTAVEVRKFKSYQCPLKVMISWCSKGKLEYENNLKNKKFFLQENDPGSIEWNNFSIPELQSFLKILTQEEECKRKDICLRYGILKSEIKRCQKRITPPEA